MPFPPQFEVLAVDSGRPTRTTTADVTVLVTRDEFAPEFISTPYTATITENAAINSTILTVRATDRDLEVRVLCLMISIHQSSLSSLPTSLSVCRVRSCTVWWVCRGGRPFCASSIINVICINVIVYEQATIVYNGPNADLFIRYQSSTSRLSMSLSACR